MSVTLTFRNGRTRTLPEGAVVRPGGVVVVSTADGDEIGKFDGEQVVSATVDGNEVTLDRPTPEIVRANSVQRRES